MTTDPLDLDARERDVRARQEEAKLRGREEIDDLKWLMRSKQGRRIVWRLLENTGVFRTSFTGDNETFFREGMRNVGLILLAQINDHCSDRYVTMIEERKHGRSDSNGNGGIARAD